MDRGRARRGAARQARGRRELLGDRQAQVLDRPRDPAARRRHDPGQQAHARGVLPALLPAVGRQAAARPDAATRATSTFASACTAAASPARPPPSGTASPAPWCDVDPALRPELKRRGHADPRRPGQGAPQGRPQEGPQEASVLQALASAARWRRENSSGPMVSAGPSGELLTPDLAVRLGRAAALEAEAERPQVLIVRDTRESGPMLEEALAGGDRRGRRGRDAGRRPADAGRIGADPPAELRPGGGRLGLPQPLRRQRDQVLRLAGDQARRRHGGSRSRRGWTTDTGERVGGVRQLEGAFDDYIRELRGAFQLDLSGMRIALDCANGATHRAAPAIFRRPRRRPRADRRRARRPQHQRRLRLDAPRGV